VRGALAFAVFKAEIQLVNNEIGIDHKAIIAAVERIRACMAHGPYHQSSAYVPALSAAVRKLVDTGNPAARREAVHLVRSVNVSQISRVRSEKYESHAESFFAAASKALDGDSQCRVELIAICRLALKSDVLTNTRNVAWITFRLAKAIEEDAPDEALALLDGLTSDARKDGMTTLYVRLLRQAGRHEDALAAARSFARNLDFGKLEFAHPVLVDLMELLPGGPVRTSLVVFLQHAGLNKRARGIDPKVVTAAKALGLPEPAKLPDAKLVVMLSDLKSDL